MGGHCCEAIYEKAIRSRLGHAERLYAAVTDQLLNVRARPGRLGGVEIFGAAADPLPSRPNPSCFASPDRRSE